MENVDVYLLSTFPDPQGTKVSWRRPDGTPVGNDKYVSIAWTARNRPTTGGGGCCQWIRYVVIADDLASAQRAAADGLAWETQLASSSRSSKDLQVIYVDATGGLKAPKAVNNSVVPTFKMDGLKKIALELCFGDAPFNPNLQVQDDQGGKQTLAQLEAACGTEPCPKL